MRRGDSALLSMHACQASLHPLLGPAALQTARRLGLAVHNSRASSPGYPAWLLRSACPFCPVPHFMSPLQSLTLPLSMSAYHVQAMVLLAGSGSMCRDSAGLRTGYGALHSLLRRAAHAVYTWHLPLLSRWPAAVWALGLEPSSPTCTATSAAGPTPAARADQPSAVAASGAANAQADALARLCISYQLPILLLVGFGLSTWLAYRAERSSRVAWLTHLQQSGGSGAASAAADDGSRGSGGSPRAGANPDAADLALQRAAETELIGPLPNDADYWLQLALPCMLCIGAVAHTIV